MYKVSISMRDRNVLSYTSKIVGYAVLGCAREAIKFSEEMMRKYLMR